MDEHFRAFSFVDRIDSVRPGASIRGRYTIPDAVAAFSASLVAEAVGQLAAWAAMAAVDFRRRPVAGIAAEIDLLALVRPGQVLELAAELEAVDDDAAAYAGTAHADGIPVIRLQHCVGPMMPVEEFDDPQALRARYALLQAAGATPGAFRGLPNFPLQRTGGEAGQSLRATFHVPDSAPFFGDHFPRRPVFPGTLLINANLELAAELATALPAPSGEKKWALSKLSDVKLRAFTPPGASLEMEARLTALSDRAANLTVETRNDKRLISGARVLLVPEERS